MLVRKVRYETAIEENDAIRRAWLRTEGERDSANVEVYSLKREVALLKENLNNVTAELTRERSARIDAEQALKQTRESFGDVEVRGIRLAHNTEGYLTHWFFGTGRDVVYNEDLRYAEIYDGEGRFVAGAHNVVSYEVKYRTLEEDEEE